MLTAKMLISDVEGDGGRKGSLDLQRSLRCITRLNIGIDGRDVCQNARGKYCQHIREEWRTGGGGRHERDLVVNTVALKRIRKCAQGDAIEIQTIVRPDHRLAIANRIPRDPQSRCN